MSKPFLAVVALASAFCHLATAQITAPGLHPISFSSATVRPTSVTATRFSLPLVFEPNRGQADPQVRYMARGAGYTLFLTDTEAVMAFPGKAPVRMRLLGDNAPGHVEATDPTGGVSHYLLGNDPSKWHTNIPHYRTVRYAGVRPGVDEVFYGNAGQLEYDLVVAPGTDPAQITMEYDGARSLRVDSRGDLLLATESGEVRMHRPTVYQTDRHGNRIAVAAAFRVKGRKSASFLLARYDTRRELVIDPSVEYATYLGGSSNDQGNAIAVDSSGNAIVAGLTRSTDFPTLNPISNSGYGGGISDAFVTKINPAGTALIYSTYLGGSNTDRANGVAVDSAGNAYVTGSTLSSNFPVQNALQGTNKNTSWGTGSAFVVKLNPRGLLTYSTYLGGSGANGTVSGFIGGDSGAGIGVDAAGNAYIAGTASSADFPTANPIQAKKGLFSSLFVTKISADASTLVYSTFYGGQQTYGYGIAVDVTGNAYVAGQASVITGFPVQQTITPAGNGDVFVIKVTPAGSLAYSTLIGTGQPVGIAADGSGNVYIAGTIPALGSSYPLAKPLYSTGTSFVSKLNATGTALTYSTLFPGSVLSAIAIDAASDVYLTGSSGSSAFPLKNAFQPTAQQNVSAIISALNPDASGLLYSTFLGADADGYGIASDAAGDVYVTGLGIGLPPDTSAFQPSQKGYPDAFVFAYATAAAPSVTSVNAASYAVGPVATNSIASAFAPHLATQTASAVGTLGTTLGGTTVNITDGNSVTTAAQIFFASPTQVNFLIPAGIATGQGQVQVTAGDGTVTVGPLSIALIAPGIFTADGKLAVGQALQVDAQGNQTTLSLVTYNSVTGQFVPTPLNLSAPGSSTYLILYGTGIRSTLLAKTTAQVGNQTVTPAYAGAQGSYAGLDQVNIQLPNSLAGSGDTTLTLTAEGITSNAVHITVQ